MNDGDGLDQQLVPAEAMNAVLAASGGPQRRQRRAELLSDPKRVLPQRTIDERESGSGNRFG